MATGADRRGGRTRPGAGAVDPAEAALFREAMRDAKPLAPGERAADPAPAQPPAGPPAASAKPPSPPPPSPPPRAEAPAGLDRRSATRLRRGLIRPEARLDLHGSTQAQAHRALAEFVAGSRAAGRRCVLVITGRGELGAGVLRAQLPRWLDSPPIRAGVLGVAPAQPRDGGAGAFYVLLRRSDRPPRR